MGIGEAQLSLVDQPDRMDVRDWSQRAEWVERYLQSSTDRYVLGCNSWAVSIARAVGVRAIIDDFVEFESYEGVPVLRSTDLPAGAMVVSAIVGERPISAGLFLHESGFDFIDYYSFLKLSGSHLKPIPFWGGFEDDYSANNDRYTWLRTQLTDDVSRDTFDRIIAFRCSLDLNHMSPFTNRQSAQYFEDFVPYPSAGVFYDIGSFDGFTSREFVRHSVKYAAIHAFEPSATNALVVKTNLSNLHDVTVHQVMLGSRHGKTRIIEDGSSSRESSDEGQPVSIRTLDSLELEPPTFMKIDIEGAELDFLEGARNTIAQYEPTIAIACYHAPSHLWKIPQLVMEIVPSYEVYLRHYTEGVTETVLTFVNPNQR
jgi:FkbM family methyltransferase